MGTADCSVDRWGMLVGTKTKDCRRALQSLGVDCRQGLGIMYIGGDCYM